jgi:hypothetical protein
VRYRIKATLHSPVLALLLLLLFSIACGTTRALRDAQDSFNDAATADMELRTAPEETTATLLGVRDGGYRTTVRIIDSFNAAQRADLRGNKLWGNALMLKAMSQWRLGDYDEAGKTAEDATKNFGDHFGSRDGAVLSVLDGLIAIDQAHGKLIRKQNGSLECVYRDVDELVANGLRTIEAGRSDLSAGEPVQLYLLQAKLAGHRTRQEAEDCDDGGEAPSSKELEEMKNDYCALEEAGAKAEVLMRWQGALGLDGGACRQ